MYLNSIAHKQKGFLLPLALFIIVVAGFFSLVLSRNTIQTNNSALLEVISTQAFYAAESGTQQGMQVLFFPDASSRNAADTRCLALNTTYNFAVTGLNNCSALVTCACTYPNGATCSPSTASNYSTAASSSTLTSFYALTSVATCGGGNFSAKRTIQAGAFLKQE